MSLAIVQSRAQLGVVAPLVTVEVHLSGGLPATSIVGLPEAAVRESRDRVRAAMINAMFEFPQRRITVGLAPADLPKDGSRFDLAIALGILAASNQIPESSLAEYEIFGELALSGELRPITGVLPAVLQACKAGRRVILPHDNGAEAALVGDAEVYTARSLLQVCAFLRGDCALPRAQAEPVVIESRTPDLRDVCGQAMARRALEVAAAGGHNLLFIGPPGTGKTMLASRLPGILPPMTENEALESAAIASIAGMDVRPFLHQRSFRNPHHSASGVALVGGGSIPRPGEVSLAHNGVLFLDELPEFDRRVLEVLREPMESGRILISRAARQAEFPARFQLVAAMNPCPCGYAGDPSGRCRCSADTVARYRGRISGPMLDRIDMHVEVPRVPPAQWREPGEDSATVRARVLHARALQQARSGKPNALLGTLELARDAALSQADRVLLDSAAERLGLSARAHQRILRVARSIADLAGSDAVLREHLTEAIGYRRLDRIPMAAVG
jgi:magnesium chelatase family protein